VACHTLKKYNGIRKPDGKFQLGVAAYDVADELQRRRASVVIWPRCRAWDDVFGGAAAGAATRSPIHTSASR